MNDGTTRYDGAIAARRGMPIAPSVMGRVENEFGFELNTDSHLINQEWGDFEALHDRRYGLAIDHLKAKVRGRAYDNEAMRLRVGPQGYYTQSKRFPAAFFGDTGHASVSFVDGSEAAALVWELVAHYRAEEASSLTAVYETGDPFDFFFGYAQNDWRRYELGHLRRSMPIHMRVLFAPDSPVSLLDDAGGVIIYHRTRGGKHLVLKAKGRRRPLLNGGQLG